MTHNLIEEAPFLTRSMSGREEKSLSQISTRSEARIGCADEGHQNLTHWLVSQWELHDSQSYERVKVMSPAGLGTKNECTGEGQQQFTDRPTDRLTG
jgi:hypothetical protein